MILEFFGDWTIRLEANLNHKVAALWLLRKKARVNTGEALTHYGLYALLVSFAALAALKISARFTKISAFATTGGVGLMLVPVFLGIIRMYTNEKPPKVEMEYMKAPTAKDFEDFAKQIQLQTAEIPHVKNRRQGKADNIKAAAMAPNSSTGAQEARVSAAEVLTRASTRRLV